MSFALRAADVIDALVGVFGKLAVVLVLALVALVSWNVFGRYIVGGTPVWQQELEWHLLAPIALFGTAYLMRERGHVRVDMVYERLSQRLRDGLDLFSMAVGVMVCALMIKYSYGYVATSFGSLEGSPDPGGLPARYALKALIPLGFALLGLQCLAHAIRHAASLTGHRPGGRAPVRTGS